MGKGEGRPRRPRERPPQPPLGAASDFAGAAVGAGAFADGAAAFTGGAPASWLVVYVTCAENECGAANHAFFMRHGVAPWLGRADFVVVVNGAGAGLAPAPAGTRVLRRPNAGFDFGAWGEALRALEAEGALARYDRVAFVNNSVLGPLRPRWARGQFWGEQLGWELGRAGAGGRPVWLAGCTRNFELGEHVQSYAFAATREGLAALRPLFAPVPEGATKDALIREREVRTAALVRAAGGAVATLEPDGALLRASGCPWGDRTLALATGDPYATLFVKARRLPADVVAHLTAAQDADGPF